MALPVTLNAEALRELDRAGVTPAAWALHVYNDAMWFGDECGCPNPRCAGEHHGLDEPCMCLPQLLDPYDSMPDPFSEL